MNINAETPRRETPEPAGAVKPVIGLPRAGLSNLAIAVLALIMGTMLFSVLEARRQNSRAPAVTNPRLANFQSATSPPPLNIPPEAIPQYDAMSQYGAGTQNGAGPSQYEQSDSLQPQSSSAPVPLPSPVPAQPGFRPNPSPSASLNPSSISNVPTPPIGQVQIKPTIPERTSSGSALTVDYGNAASSAKDGGAQGNSNLASGSNTDRARASMLANRSKTVAQGTLIRAVLETALNTTNEGFSRAIISNNIYSFDGTQILIPRGSRLIGEYGADTQRGQNRALINWTRLIRPDGATIAIGSPATDPLGRGGIKADVNSHFFERFGSAILQSVLDIGVNAVARRSNNTIILTTPGGQGTNSSPSVQPQQIKPTLKVKAGTSISVFVARDLDFSDVEARE
jgi:type IV secretion system protein VirB10